MARSDPRRAPRHVEDRQFVTRGPVNRPDIRRNEVKSDEWIVGDGVAKITVSATAPTNPRVGDLWVDTGA